LRVSAGISLSEHLLSTCELNLRRGITVVLDRFDVRNVPFDVDKGGMLYFVSGACISLISFSLFF